MPLTPGLKEELHKLRKAARASRERGDALSAIALYEEACAKAEAGPCEPRLHAQLELELGALFEEDLGRLDQAIDRYQRATRLNPDDTAAIEAGRRVFRALGDWEQVARLYEVELEVLASGDPKRRAKLLLQLGLVRGKKVGDLIGAAVRLEEAVRLRGDDEEAKEALASLYVSPDFPQPEDDAIGPPERAARLFIELADARRKKQDPEGEVAFLRRALGADPYHVDAAARLEQAYLALGRREELRHLYRTDAPVPHRAVKQALSAVEAGDLDEAIEAVVLAHAEGDDVGEAVERIEQQLAAKQRFGAIAELKERLLEHAAVDGAERADWLVPIADLYQKAGEPTKQEAVLRAALDAAPAHREAFQRLSEFLGARREYVLLTQLAEDAIAAAPIEEQPQRLAELAELYEKKLGDAAAAQDAWLRAEAILPSQHGQHELKRLKHKQDRWASVTAALERELAAAPVGPARADVLKRLAQVHRERRDLEQARALLEEALELRPDDPALYRALADMYEHAGDVDQVAKTIKRQLKVSREKVEKLNLLRRLALIYDERLGDNDGVIWACEEILAVLPGDRDAFRRLESAYTREGEGAEEALIAVLEKHAQASATPAERIPLWHRLAALHEKRGDYAAASDRLERILKLDKSDQRAQDAIARVYERQERWAEAALALDRVLARSDKAESADAWKRFARIVDGKLGDPTRAVRAWREVLERRPTDREALEAMSRLARARGDLALLDEVLARRATHAEGEEAAAIAVERAALLEQQRDLPGAVRLLRQVLDDLDPRNLEAHARLRHLERELGNLEGALRIAERELFLEEDGSKKLDIALDIARAWREALAGGQAQAAGGTPDPRRAISAYERVIDFDPAHEEALEALAELYGQAGEWERQLVINEHRLELAQGENDARRAITLYFELAFTAEEQLGDPSRAFEYFRKAHELEGSDGTLGELRRVAEQHGLWEEMCAVYATMKGLEPRLRVAEISDEKLRDPRRAFAVLKSSLELDPTGETLEPELERLAERASEWGGLLEVYDALLERRHDVDDQLALLRKRAQVKEARQKDGSGALDEMLRAFRIAPDDASILAEIHRLAEATGRWEDALAVEGARFHRASGDQRLEIAVEAARLVETKVKDDLRAFRAYLRAFQLAPEDDDIRDNVWRLARKLDVIDDAASPPPPVVSLPPVVASAPPPPRVPAPSPTRPPKPGREPTLEVNLEKAAYSESGAIILDLNTGEIPLADPPPPPQAGRDPTMELSLGDLLPVLRGPPPAPATMELSLSDVAVVRKPVQTPPPVPIAQRPPAVLKGPHSAWDELAVVILGLGGDSFARLVQVAEMWEKGAGDLDRAFEALASAFRVDPTSEEARAALERLAESNEAWDQLVAVLDDTLESSGSAELAVQLLVDSARVRERQGDLADAEERYSRALGIRPDDASALESLETLYRSTERLNDLASLLERRLSGLIERMAHGEARRERALELASVYEALGNTYEAIDAWRRVAEEYPDHAPAFASLARLYEGVGQWSKVVESLTRELDVIGTTQAGATREGRARVKELRRRIGEIYEKELELPERAIEAYSALHDADPDDEGAEAALERLYEKLHRFAELDELWRRREARTRDARAKARLLEQRAALLQGKLHDEAAAVEVLRTLRELRPEDDAIADRLEALLRATGDLAEQAELVRERLVRLGKRAPKEERGRLLVRLGRLEAQLGDAQEAQRTLERALDLLPSDPEALAELARLREGGSDWDGYAAAREREAEVAQSREHAVRALVDAGRVHLERRRDDAAARRCFERALEKDPRSAEAMGPLATLLRRAGEHDAADALAERELQLDGEGAPNDHRRAELYALLGASHLRKGEHDEAGRAYREAMGAVPGFPAAVEGLADLAARTGHWDEVEALLRNAAARDGVPPEVAAQFYHRLATAAEHQGRGDDAYTALLEADRLLPGDLLTRVQLGENRYRMNRFREAAQYLGSLVDHPKLDTLPEEAGTALYHGALAELKLRRPERAMPLLEAAVRTSPNQVDALGLLAERTIEAGDLARAAQLLEQQAAATQDPKERALRFERVGSLILRELKDAERACAAFEHALAAAGDGASDELVEKTLELERQTGRLERAAETAARLLEREAPPRARARRLREAASLDAALGRAEEAQARLKAALELDPLSHEALAGLSAMLVSGGRDDEAATLLTRALSHMPSTTDATIRAARATLWMRLGECRERLRDVRGALHAFERAVELDPSRRGLREALLERYGDDVAYDEQARAHRVAILAEDPLHVPSLRHMAALEARLGRRDGGRRFLELLAVAGALRGEERSRLAALQAPDAKLDESAVGSLDEDDHALMAHADATVLAPVFAALWEGTAPERAPDLASFGVRAEDRVSPVANSDLARAYALCARALGNRKTGLYLKPDPAFTAVQVVAHPPTAVIVGPPAAEGRPVGEIRFLLGRALEIARPEYVLAAALSREEFTRLFAAILRAFHPRHARRRLETGSGDHARDDEAAKWKRALPYKVAKRLAELFTALQEASFSSAKWRRAVQHTGNRAGLVAAGDLVAAARVLRSEGDEEAVRELARFASSDDYLALRTKLTIR